MTEHEGEGTPATRSSREAAAGMWEGPVLYQSAVFRVALSLIGWDQD